MWKYEYGVAYLNREKGKKKSRKKGRYWTRKGEFVVSICDNRYELFFLCLIIKCKQITTKVSRKTDRTLTYEKVKSRPMIRLNTFNPHGE